MHVWCADIEARKAAAETEAVEAAARAEEKLLEQAREIRRARDRAARPPPAAHEPKRGKAHWDFVLEEMAWLAKEFSKCVPANASCFAVPHQSEWADSCGGMHACWTSLKLAALCRARAGRPCACLLNRLA